MLGMHECSDTYAPLWWGSDHILLLWEQTWPGTNRLVNVTTSRAADWSGSQRPSCAVFPLRRMPRPGRYTNPNSESSSIRLAPTTIPGTDRYPLSVPTFPKKADGQSSYSVYAHPGSPLTHLHIHRGVEILLGRPRLAPNDSSARGWSFIYAVWGKQGAKP